MLATLSFDAVPSTEHGYLVLMTIKASFWFLVDNFHRQWNWYVLTRHSAPCLQNSTDRHHMLARMGTMGPSLTAGADAKWGSRLADRVATFYKTKHALAHIDPAVTLLGIYSKEVKTCLHTETCTWRVIRALFVNAQTRKWASVRTSGERGVSLSAEN